MNGDNNGSFGFWNWQRGERELDVGERESLRPLLEEFRENKGERVFYLIEERENREWG